MTRLHDLWLPKHNPLIARLHEFRNDIVGVAAFPSKTYAVQLMLTLQHLITPAIDQTVHHIEKLIRQGVTDRM